MNFIIKMVSATRSSIYLSKKKDLFSVTVVLGIGKNLCKFSVNNGIVELKLNE